MEEIIKDVCAANPVSENRTKLGTKFSKELYKEIEQQSKTKNCGQKINKKTKEYIYWCSILCSTF